MNKVTGKRCKHTVNLDDGKTDEERYREALRKAVDAAFENLKPVREKAGLD